MYTFARVDYVFMQIDGKVMKKGIDAPVLKRIMVYYAAVEVFLNPLAGMIIIC